MQTDSLRATEAKPQRNEAQRQIVGAADQQASQRAADAAAKRPSPPDEAQISPRGRALAAQEESTAKPQRDDQQRVDERRTEQRQVEAQSSVRQQAASRFEVVA
jgi:hypothetical protein